MFPGAKLFQILTVQSSEQEASRDPFYKILTNAKILFHDGIDSKWLTYFFFKIKKVKNSFIIISNSIRNKRIIVYVKFDLPHFAVKIPIKVQSSDNFWGPKMYGDVEWKANLRFPGQSPDCVCVRAQGWGTYPFIIILSSNKWLYINNDTLDG